jgi:hypothetical protein
MKEKSEEACSSVSIITDYLLEDREITVLLPAEAKGFSPNLCVQTGSGAHPASCPMDTGGPFPETKERPGRNTDHSPHLVMRLRMSRSYTSSPPSASMACRGIVIFLDVTVFSNRLLIAHKPRMLLNKK